MRRMNYVLNICSVVAVRYVPHGALAKNEPIEIDELLGGFRESDNTPWINKINSMC